MQDFTPFKLPFNFWSKARASLFVLIGIGLFRVVIAITVYYQINQLVLLMQNEARLNVGLMLILTALLVTVVVLRIQERKIAEDTGQYYVNTIRSILLKRLMRVSIREVNQQPVGKIAGILSGDLNALKRWISLGLSRLVVNTIMVAGCMVFVVLISPVIALALATVLLILLSINVLLGAFLGKRLATTRSNRIKLNSLVIERLSQMQAIRASGQELYEVEKVNKRAGKLHRALLPEGVLFGAIRGVAEITGPIMIITLLFSYLLTGAVMSMAEIISLISLFGFMTAPIRELSRLQDYYQGAKLSLAKIHRLYSQKRIVRGRFHHRKVNVTNAEVRIYGLSYSDCLDNVSLHIKTKEKWCIAGENGSGKSTLLNLIMGLLKPEHGKVRINGINPLKISVKQKSRLFGVYRVGDGLIRGTLKENIIYRKRNATAVMITRVIEKCQLKDLVGSLEKGLDSSINESGNNLSSGQITRILLARAILGTPPILLLDEPEASLDKSGIKLLKNIIEQYPHTVILVTHQADIAVLCEHQFKLNSSNKANITIIKERSRHVDANK
ncbi:MAG: ABC transporter ATP-binding protein/permease [Proteobacteria bacterium]|nr:ABC transporter ATP-binding protein/permease [Pseudomonadota bacterium]